MNLAEKWHNDKKRRSFTFATSVRLCPDVDSMLQDILSEFPHLTQTQIINDALRESLVGVLNSIPDT